MVSPVVSYRTSGLGDGGQKHIFQNNFVGMRKQVHAKTDESVTVSSQLIKDISYIQRNSDFIHDRPGHVKRFGDKMS